MKNIKLSQRIMLVLNVLVIAVILVLNYFYQKNGFDFTLKCICSGSFAALGVVDLIYALAAVLGVILLLGVFREIRARERNLTARRQKLGE